jgi:hypothetical protein
MLLTASMECTSFNVTEITISRFLLAQLKLENVLGDYERPECDMWDSLTSDSPNQLNAFYEKIIDQITRLGEKNRIRAFRALSWVLLAARPLTMDELREAVLIEPESTEINPAVMGSQKWPFGSSEIAAGSQSQG